MKRAHLPVGACLLRTSVWCLVSERSDACLCLCIDGLAVSKVEPLFPVYCEEEEVLRSDDSEDWVLKENRLTEEVEEA